jgi:DNA polymerase III subunit gamma/tau
MDQLIPNHDDAKAAGYRVLARKYRPSTFADLIGQEPLVRTLTNAFATGRIAQAYMLTGVRGVGKTTTARILARALNYEAPGVDGPSLDMAEEGEQCRAILESRHVDVIEMDAASHTGIDDIREIIEAVRYRPAQARYKVYIVDEVHMLSKAAFNGLLKTLEEPPEHVKFIFATTEIRKVPVTVLSRCQRFDLRRVEAGELVAHLKKVAGAEGVTADDEALAAIARASEGSVRDALSLLDQAISHSGGTVEAGAVRAMLGVADRGRIVELFGHVMAGRIAAALDELDAQYAEGAAPETVLTDLAAFTHLVTRIRIVPEAASDVSLSPEEREKGSEFAQTIAIPELTRAWQILLKGIAETETSPRPLAAAEMVLIRLAHAASLPSPEEVIRRLSDAPAGQGMAAPPAPPPAPHAPSGGNGGTQGATALAHRAAPVTQAGTAEPDAAGRPLPTSLAEVAALAAERRDLLLKAELERHVQVVAFEAGRIEIALTGDAPGDLAQRLGRALNDWTGTRWMVTVSREAGAPTLREQAERQREALVDDMRRHPAVGTVLDRFPGARIVDVRMHDAPDAEALPDPDIETPDEEA